MPDWLDTLNDQSKVEAMLTWMDENTPANKLALACRHYAGTDRRFALWLYLCGKRAQRLYRLSIFDLADVAWRDMFDNGDSPRDALAEAMRGDEVMSLLLRR